MRRMRAPAKINLTLHVKGRRDDGYHDLESLVAFGGICDWLEFEPGSPLALEVVGPHAIDAGPVDENLVFRAACALASRIPGLTLGRFRLTKRIPGAAGLGGGSADAAAALRVLADANGLSIEDARLHWAARETGADVPVCLCPRARIMEGVGDRLGPPIALPRTFALLVNPRVESPTPKIFAALGLAPGTLSPSFQPPMPHPSPDPSAFWDFVKAGRNDLETAASRVVPEVGVVLERLCRISKAVLARMSGSGSTCFALFQDRRDAAAARRMIAAERPEWWVRATVLR